MAIIPGIYASQISGHLIPPSSFYSIATVTAAGGEASLSFTSIPQGYKSLQIRAIARDTYANTQGAYDVGIQLNNDTATDYAYHQLLGNGSAAVATGGVSSNSMYWPSLSSSSNASNTTFYGAGYCDIIDYSSTTKNKTIRTMSGFNFNTTSTAYRVQLSSGLWINTAAITSIKLLPGVTAFAAGSTFSLYGVS